MTAEKIPVLLIGAGGHGHSVTDTIECEGKYRIVGYVDDVREPGSEVWGYPVLGGLADFANIVQATGCKSAFVAIGDCFQRQSIAVKLRTMVPDIQLITTIHPTAIISPSVEIGQGVVIMAGVIINAGAVVGDGCLINTRASIDHDCVLGEYASIAPGVILGGTVNVGARSHVGQGSTVIQKITIGQDSVIGAGSVVVSDLPEHIVAHGSPCRVVRNRDLQEGYL